MQKSSGQVGFRSFNQIYLTDLLCAQMFRKAAAALSTSAVGVTAYALYDPGFERSLRHVSFILWVSECTHFTGSGPRHSRSMQSIDTQNGSTRQMLIVSSTLGLWRICTSGS